YLARRIGDVDAAEIRAECDIDHCGLTVGRDQFETRVDQTDRTGCGPTLRTETNLSVTLRLALLVCRIVRRFLQLSDAQFLERVRGAARQPEGVGGVAHPYGDFARRQRDSVIERAAPLWAEGSAGRGCGLGSTADRVRDRGLLCGHLE